MVESNKKLDEKEVTMALDKYEASKGGPIPTSRLKEYAGIICSQFSAPKIKYPKESVEHEETGQECGCAYIVDMTPCQIQQEIIDLIKTMNK